MGALGIRGSGSAGRASPVHDETAPRRPPARRPRRAGGMALRV